MDNKFKQILAISVVSSIFFGSIFGGAAGYFIGKYPQAPGDPVEQKQVRIVNEQSAVIDTVKKVSPAVVSIIVSKDLPKIEQYNAVPNPGDFFGQFFGNEFNDFFNFPQQPQYRQNGTEKREVGGGSGFIITQDGYVVTNRHVVDDPSAEYTVLMNNETKYTAKVLARDPVNDLAILKIDAKNLPTLELGDSAGIKVGQQVIAIGNALGQFSNTVSTGVISGLLRTITAGGDGGSENLVGVIQTDASINPGNSGGPLLNIEGQVIGINVAVAQGANGIGFALPINEVKNSIESVKKEGRIIRPWLGVRYQQISKGLADENKLPVSYGALIIKGEKPTDLAVIPGSPADKAGLIENDIILEVNGKKIDDKNPLVSVIGKFRVGDTVTLKVLEKGKEKTLKLTLEEMK